MIKKSSKKFKCYSRNYSANTKKKGEVEKLTWDKWEIQCIMAENKSKYINKTLQHYMWMD